MASPNTVTARHTIHVSSRVCLGTVYFYHKSLEDQTNDDEMGEARGSQMHSKVLSENLRRPGVFELEKYNNQEVVTWVQMTQDTIQLKA